MAYKDPAAQREYQRRWMAARRARYLAGMTCVDCGSDDRIEIDHIDRTKKSSHRIWSWSDAKLRAELEKCEPRCRDCHVKRHQQEFRKHGQGEYKRGCRCDVCVTANREKARRYREQRRQRIAVPLTLVDQTGQTGQISFDLREAA